jgi:hypothetical protein
MQKCDVCKIDIPENNFEIHQVQCRKNTINCPKCNILIPKSKFEEHNTELHSLKNCIYCNNSFEIMHFENHPCSDPPIICNYCEAHFPTSQFAEHKSVCENKTEQCIKCEKYIKLKDLAEHYDKDNCIRYEDNSSVSSESSDQQMMHLNFQNMFQQPIPFFSMPSDRVQNESVKKISRISGIHTIGSKRRAKIAIRQPNMLHFYCIGDYIQWKNDD